MINPNPLLSSYLALINSLSYDMRLNLLLALAESLQPNSADVKPTENKTEKQQTSSYLHLFGSWESDETADEIIADIYSSRKDRPALVYF